MLSEWMLNHSLKSDCSHVAALSPEPLGVDPGDEVEGVHVAVHAHRDAFLEKEFFRNEKLPLLGE